MIPVAAVVQYDAGEFLLFELVKQTNHDARIEVDGKLQARGDHQFDAALNAAVLRYFPSPTASFQTDDLMGSARQTLESGQVADLLLRRRER